jgi:hypothetical protein
MRLIWSVHAVELCALGGATLRERKAETLAASLGRLIAAARRVT